MRNHVKPALPAGKSLEDLGYTPSVRPMKLDILAATLPYAVTEFRQWGGGITAPETAALPDAHRYKLAATVQTGAGTTLINAYTMNMPDIAALDRLTSANEGTNTESYTYDWLGNRKTKTTNGTTLAYGRAGVG